MLSGAKSVTFTTHYLWPVINVMGRQNSQLSRLYTEKQIYMYCILPKISPLPSSTSKFLHRISPPLPVTEMYRWQKLMCEDRRERYIFRNLDGLSPLFVRSFCYISWPKHRNKLKRFVDEGSGLATVAIGLGYDCRQLVT